VNQMNQATKKKEADDLRLETLSGDLRDILLMNIRDMKRPWSLLTEDEQRDLAGRLELGANDLIRRIVRMVTDFDFPQAVVALGEVKIKGEKGIEAKISCANIEHNRSTLGEAVGDMVLLLCVSSDQFMNERAPAAIDPDQASLGVEDHGAYPDSDDE
jgi:hypothetical protein